MLTQLLKQREKEGNRIRVAVVGCGAMGLGVAYQVGHAAGMEVVLLADRNGEVIGPAADFTSRARHQRQRPPVTTGCLDALQHGPEYDVLVECTTSIEEGVQYCLAAIERGAHVVLMNAEVDIAFGPLLRQEAARKGVIVTSDAGDQHGVIAQVVDQLSLWGFEVVQAGNIKGFLNRYATPDSLREEAAKRRLNPVPCCAYTDGTKLNIEMALLCNAFGWQPFVRGMQGPRCARVEEVLGLFPFDDYGGEAKVDYILGAEPGGGVYVVARCEDGFDFQQPYLSYYKLGSGPYYVFYRPNHLCHIETPYAIGLAALKHAPLLQPWAGRVADVYAFAKRDLAAGETVVHGIGGEHFYGMIESAAVAVREGLVPMWMLETEVGSPKPVLAKAMAKDAPLTADAIGFPDSPLYRMAARQRELAG
jgi:predicted homoserine dehydrogenase-like protein